MTHVPAEPAVIDVPQLRTIEATHRGMLYQHLYAVGCLLLAQGSGVLAVSIERDEDLELQLADRRVYIQVKTRSEPLMPSDISDVIERFDTIRALHTSGERPGSGEFLIISNQPPGPKLRGQLASPSWLLDVQLVYPGNLEPLPVWAPPAWPTLGAAADWCIRCATNVPLRIVSADTLVFKLAALVQLAATGERSSRGHRFDVGELPELFEQIVVQLQTFPPSPRPYRPQESEPDIASSERVRIIVGLSGAGKTAWASEATTHAANETTYFDVGSIPGPALASALVRDLAAQFVERRPEGLGPILRTGASGLESLRALDGVLARQSRAPMVFLDNIHRIAPGEVRALIEATPSFRWVLLAQPWPGLTELEAILGAHPQRLAGWSLVTIAEELDAQGAKAPPAAAARVRQLTAGLPLFTRDLAMLAKRDYEGDTLEMCADIEARVTLTDTAQDVILGRVVAGFSAHSRAALGFLIVADVPLAHDEALRIIEAGLSCNRHTAAHAIRELTRWGVVQTSHVRQILVHEAFRGLGLDEQLRCDASATLEARRELVRILESSFDKKFDVRRYGLYLRLLPDIGQMDLLADIASDQSEQIREYGLASELLSTLERVTQSSSLSESDRFWALDAIAFWRISEKDFQGARAILDRMKLLAPAEQGRAKATIYIKEMAIAADAGDIAEARSLFHAAARAIPGEAWIMRMLRHNFAAAMFRAGQYTEAEKEAAAQIHERLRIIGITRKDLFRKNVPEVSALLASQGMSISDTKHLADAFDLYAMARRKQGKSAILDCVNANKLYAVTRAALSAVRTGQDVVDEFLGIGDVPGARQFMERTLLPLLHEFKLTDLLVPVRGQYAVVLAYNGLIDEARAEMQQLAVFQPHLPQQQRVELENQVKLIEDIASGRHRLRPWLRRDDPAQLMLLPPKTIGRNDPCPCGSGLKYKKCHGG